MKNRFKITYETITAGSARSGSTATSGFLPKSGEVPIYRDNMPKNPARFTLRQAIELMQTGGSSPVEADSYPCKVPRWLTSQISADNGGDYGRVVNLSIHLDEISDASARRVARLFGIRLV